MATKLNYSVSLDGSTDAFSIADHADFKPTGNFTVGGWIKTSSANQQTIFASFSANTNWAGFVLSIVSGTIHFFSARNTGTGPQGTAWQDVGSTSTFNDGLWHLVVATWDGSYLRIYVDGLLNCTPVAWTYAPAYAATNYVRVGCQSNSGTNAYFVNGNLKNIFLINGTALTQAEIATKMFQDLTGTTNLKAYYKFENDATDSSGQGHDLTDIGSPTYSSGAEDVPHTYYLESEDNLTSLDLEQSTNDYAYINDANQTGLDFSTTFTLEAWVNFESLPANTVGMMIASKDENTKRAYAFYLYNNGGTYILCSHAFNTTNYDQYYVAWTPVVGTWYNVAVTCNTGNASATTFEFFVDGVSKGNGTALSSNNISTISDTSAAFSIGSYYVNMWPFDGKIDGVKAFSDVRTSSEILSDMFSKSVTDANLVGEWQFDGDALDSTANDNDLTLSGSPIYSPDVPFDARGARQSMKLVTGSSQAVSIVTHADLSPTGAFTIGAWIKTTTTGKSIFSNYTSSGSELGFELHITSNVAQFYIAGQGAVTATTSLVNGAWHFVVGTYDGTHLKLYIDGTQEGGDVDSSAASYGTNYVRIGCNPWGTGTRFFDGKIRNVFLVNGTAWDATKINSYLTKNIDPTETNLKLLMNLDNNYVDRSGNAHHGTPIATPTFSWIVPYDGASSSYSSTLDEVITLVDVVVKKDLRYLGENITIVDLMNKGWGKTMTEIIALADSLLRKMTKNISNSIILVDLNKKNTSRNIVDAVVVDDVVSKKPNKILSDILSVVDTVKALISGKNLTEVLTLDDSITRKLSTIKTEVLSIVDSIKKVSSRLLPEQIGVQDVVVKGTKRTITEPISIVDTIKKGAKKTFTDIISFIDTLAKKKRAIRVFTETITLIEINWRNFIQRALSWTKKTDPTSTWTEKTDPDSDWTLQHGDSHD